MRQGQPAGNDGVAGDAVMQVDSFGDVWHLHHDELVRLAWLLTSDMAHAEDIVADVMVRALGAHRSGRIRDSAAYLRRAVVNQSRSHLRRRLVRRRHANRRAGDHRGGLAYDEQLVLADHVQAAIATLPTRQREAVVLHYWLRLTVAEIAATLDVSPGTIKTALFRARATLRDRLGQER